jgi:hypothetical protein
MQPPDHPAAFAFYHASVSGTVAACSAKAIDARPHQQDRSGPVSRSPDQWPLSPKPILFIDRYINSYPYS